jgi:hypothetical protein
MESVRFALLLSVALVASACSSESPRQEGRKTTTAAQPRLGHTPVRACDDAVYGDLGRDWRDQTVLVGPVGLVASFYEFQPGKTFAALRDGVYPSQKVLLLVRRATRPTLVVPRAARGFASLLYDRSKWKNRNAYRLDEGDVAMTFEACKGLYAARPHEYTQFNGGIIVAGARCVPLDVYAEGSGKPIRATLSFGAGRCR